LTALVARGCAQKIVVVNRERKRAEGLVTDVQYGAVLCPFAELRIGDYLDLKGAALVMITAGVNEKTGGATDRNDPAGRLRLLDTNATVYKGIVSQLQAVAPQALVLVVTDPPDPLADVVRMLGHERVLSTRDISRQLAVPVPPGAGARGKPGLRRCPDRRRARHD
jgi:L-lactate dehydrogenase